MTSMIVTTGSNTAIARNSQRGVMTQTAHAVNTAQAAWSDGIAAYWSAGNRPTCLAPKPASATESTKPDPASRRGGITGQAKKIASAARLMTTSVFRIRRYCSGHQQYATTRTAMAVLHHSNSYE